MNYVASTVLKSASTSDKGRCLRICLI